MLPHRLVEIYRGLKVLRAKKLSRLCSLTSCWAIQAVGTALFDTTADTPANRPEPSASKSILRWYLLA